MEGAVVGRRRELRAIAAFLDADYPGARAVLMRGEAGIGKTAVWDAAVRAALVGGGRVFIARPSEGEQELPYAALADLVGEASVAALAEVPGMQREALEVALGRSGEARRFDGHLVARGVLELLRIASASKGVLVAIDDVQWLDRPTAAALTFAFRRLRSASIRVLVAERDAGAAAGLPLGLGDWATKLVPIGPMSVTELGAVVAGRFERPLPRPRLEAIARDSGGNPMFAMELAMAADGPVRTLPLSLVARLRRLDPADRDVLSLASASLQPSVSLLLGAGVGREQLQSALATGVIAMSGDRLLFQHPLLATAAYELLLEDERQEVHARLAGAASSAVERGHHLSRSTSELDEGAAGCLDEAADEAALLGDHAGAAAFVLRAGELSIDPGKAAKRLARAARELELAGDVAAAGALARELVERLPPGLARAEARQTLASCLVGSGLSYAEGLAQLELALADARADDATLAEVHLALAEACSGVCRLEESVGHGRAAVALAERVGDGGIAVRALGEVGFARCMLGDGVTVEARLALERWDEVVVSTNGYSPRMSLGCVYIHATRFDEAVSLFEAEIEMAEQRGLEPIEVTARGHLAEAQLRSGRWSSALEDAWIAVEHGRQAASGQIVTGASYALAMVQALLGQHEAARETATDALAEAEATGDFWFRVSHRAVLGLLAFAEDDPDAAVEMLGPAWALMLGHDLGDLSIFPVGSVLGEALVAVRRIDEAVAVAARLRSSPVGGLPWSRAMSGRIEALIASARGDHEQALLAISDTLHAHVDLPEPFEHARTMHVKGRLERNARSWGAARLSFVAALEQFDALGAARWAEKAVADIARLPGRRPATSGDLTTREREIAEFVAAGLANKEIATRLFVSVRTVESNLTRVYAKLGVRSRSELAARLAREPA
jgi:DNA-binding CsgD family transcriptional regulator/tetratricopeptide (TPR) repeat protein